MRKKIIPFLLSAVMSAVHAQSVGDMFVSMPDSLFPYLAKEQRAELVNLKRLDPSSPAVLRSVFNCDVTMSHSVVPDDILTTRIDSTVEFSIARLHNAAGDSLYCVLQTVAAPEKESVATIYNKEWERVGDVDFTGIQFVHRPDTMQKETFDNLTRLIEFPMVEGRFGNKGDIVVWQNVPMTSKEEKERLKAILKVRVLRWNGKEYSPENKE